MTGKTKTLKSLQWHHHRIPPRELACLKANHKGARRTLSRMGKRTKGSEGWGGTWEHCMHMRHHVVRFLDDIEENGRENGKVSDSIVLVRFPNSLHKRGWQYCMRMRMSMSMRLRMGERMERCLTALYAPPRRQISSCWRKKSPWKFPIPISSCPYSHLKSPR